MGRPFFNVEHRETHLLFGEGTTEKAFLGHLKSINVPQGEGFEIKVDCGEGGDPVDVVRRCLKYRGGASFASRVVLIDTDRPWCPNRVVARAASEGIRLLPSHPCVEGLLLDILGKPIPPTSNECKRAFHNDHLPEPKMMDKRNYEKLFPAELLAERTEDIPTLKAILDLMRTGIPPKTILPDA